MNKTRLTAVLCTLMLAFVLPFLSTAQEKVKKTNVECMVGKEYKIELSSTPSTGYSWSVGSPIDTTVLILKNKIFIPGKDTTLPGKPGLDVFTFKALKKGQVTVRMILKKNYARKVDRAEDYVFTISK